MAVDWLNLFVQLTVAPISARLLLLPYLHCEERRLIDIRHGSLAVPVPVPFPVPVSGIFGFCKA